SGFNQRFHSPCNIHSLCKCYSKRVYCLKPCQRNHESSSGSKYPLGRNRSCSWVSRWCRDNSNPEKSFQTESNLCWPREFGCYWTWYEQPPILNRSRDSASSTKDRRRTTANCWPRSNG